jgi:uncharacterized OB-fold protein
VTAADWGLTPVADDPETAGFFAAAAEGRLAAQRCTACGNWQQPPRPRCRECLGTDLTWQDVPGAGTLHTWTVVEHQISPSFPVPYTVILVDVVPEPGVAPLRFLGHLDGRPDLTVDDPMSVVFREHGEVTLPDWRPSATTG